MPEKYDGSINPIKLL
jgi:hypothetical protein